MEPVEADGLCKWAAVAEDADYVIAPKPLGCMTLLYLHSAAAPRKWSWAMRGDMAMISPLKGFDADGRILQLVETRDEQAGTISIEWTGLATSSKQLRARKGEEPLWSDDIAYPVVIDPTVNANITVGADDVQSQFLTFPIVSTGSVIYAGAYGGVIEYGGFRFQSIAVPAGATINSATLTVDVVGIDGTPNVKIFGNKVSSAAAWSSGNRVKNITKTTASVTKSDWSVANNVAINITSIIAEIIAQAGWASGNNLALAILNNGATGNNDVGIAALEHATKTEARLSITYTAANFSDGVVSISGAGALVPDTGFVDGAALLAGVGGLASISPTFSDGSFLLSGVGDVLAESPTPPSIPFVIVPGGGGGHIVAADLPPLKKKREPRRHVIRVGDWPAERPDSVEAVLTDDGSVDVNDLLSQLASGDAADEDEAAMAMIMSLLA
jgi:hypothetical protein